ncbi:MAG: sulfonate transport system substrate-binding protein [Marinoscillum sp.]|jgi:sulfonate transport system substrate-binding protein
MNEVTIRLGGVPEHFNLPIHLAIEEGKFSANGINLVWTDFPGGTGQMLEALETKEIDVCITLTEGTITQIIQGKPFKIISEYVSSPLIWGIHTGINNPLSSGENMFDKLHAISRFGSGSHLMPRVNANTQGLELKKEQFVVINNLNGAVESLNKLESDVFYWEKYTTKPLVDSGALKKIGEYPTPWPCFVITAHDDVLLQKKDSIEKMLEIIHTSCVDFMVSTSAISLVSSRYQQKIEDTERWFQETKWAKDSSISTQMIEMVINLLKSSDIIDENQKIPSILWPH